jgi:hypothetical protein
MTGSSLTAAMSATLFGDFSAVAAGLPASALEPPRPAECCCPGGMKMSPGGNIS